MDCATQQNIKDLITCTDELLQRKAVIRNEHGDKITLEETFDERLSWFADQLILQKKLREDPPKHPSFSDHALPAYKQEGLGPQGQMVSPLFAHMFEHHQDLEFSSKKARSFRFWPQLYNMIFLAADSLFVFRKALKVEMIPCTST